jgi:hypothetical protein
MVFIIQLYLWFARRSECKDDAREITIQREQYGGYCSSIYRHGTQPEHNYIYVPDIYMQS